jgi:hypothetical protein
LQLRRYVNLSIPAHRVEEERHASATIGAFAQGVIDFSRCDDGFRVSGTHPVDGGVDVVIGDLGAVANYHLRIPGAGQTGVRGL